MALHKKELLLPVTWLPGQSPVGRSTYRSLAQNPEYRTDALARSRKVAWSCCPLAAVYSCIAIRRIHLASSPLQVLLLLRSHRLLPLLQVLGKVHWLYFGSQLHWLYFGSLPFPIWHSKQRPAGKTLVGVLYNP